MSDPSKYDHLDTFPLTELIDWWRSHMIPPEIIEEAGIDKEDIGGAIDRFIAEVAYQIKKRDTHGADILKEAFKFIDTVWYFYALLFLTGRPTQDRDVVHELKDAVKKTRPTSIRIVAISGLTDSENFILSESEVQELLNDSNDLISAWAMVYQANANPSLAPDILLNALSSKNPRQRELACDELFDRHWTQFAKDVYPLLQDADEYVRQAATSAYEWLSDDRE